MSFTNWRKRLEAAKLPTVAERRAAISALKINFSQPGMEDEGYYRRPITEAATGADGKTNGQRRVIGWEAVAYFIDRGKLCGVIGDRDMAINEVTDEGLWSWVVSNPISEEVYRAVERGEPWPEFANDMRAPIQDGIINAIAKEEISPVLDRIIDRSHNQPAEEVLPLDVQHATAIDAAIGAALKKVTSETEAAQAAGSMNRIAELRLANDKAGKAKYEPMYREYQAEQKKWTPATARAVAKEKELKTEILTFRESERKRIAKEQAEADEKQRLADEANARAADRAIASGSPEQPPEVVEVEQPKPLAPVQATYRAPGQRAALKEVESWHLDEVTDYDAVYVYFKNNEALRATLKTLATAAVKLGQTVPGTKTHHGLI